jgi:PDZ domain
MTTSFIKTLGTALLASTAITSFAAGQFEPSEQGNASITVKASAQAQSKAKSNSSASSKNSPSGDVSSSQSSESTQSSSISDGDLTVKITKRVKTWTDEKGTTNREEKSETKAMLAGKEVPSDRIRTVNGKVEILDEKGTVIRSIAAPDMDTSVLDAEGVFVGDGGTQVRVFGQSGGSAGGSTKSGSWSGSSSKSSADGSTKQRSITLNPLGETQPKVMLGVTMEEPDEAMAKQLNVDREQATLIVSVTPELPAAKAGIQEHDVIISVDGSRPATPEKIRDALKAKEPGQDLKLSIVRRGEQKDVTVTLEAWDANKLGVGATNVMGFQLDPNVGMIEMDDDMRKQVEQMMKQFQERFSNHDFMNDDEILHQFFAPMPGGQGHMFRFYGPRGGGPRGGGPRGGAAMAVPAPNAQPGQPSNTDDRIQHLEERIDKLNDTIRRLEELLKATEENAAKGKK